MSSSGVVRGTALRAGGACVRCRKGKTKCVYETGRPPCRNCAKGMHECYLPSESMAHHHGQSPARNSSAHRAPRDSLPASGATSNESKQAGAVGSGTGASSSSRNVPATAADKLTPELIAECERVVSKTFPACVAFHKPSFLQLLKSNTLEPSLVYGLLTCASRSSITLIRRYSGPTAAAELFASKAIGLINSNLDHPNLADIQSLCLLVIHEWGTRNAVRAYVFLGQAARMLQMYRILHNHRNDPEQFIRDESFRRTLWLIYILDCFLTSTPGRHPAISAQDTADVPLPCSDINFAFGNAVQVKTLLQHLDPARNPPITSQLTPGDVGELGFIVSAATIWRDVVGMLTNTTLQNFREETCTDLINKIEGLRGSLPMQFVDKPGQINLHITMGSGYTFAVLHCLLHCSSIFVHRRRLLQEVTASNFALDSFIMTPKYHEIVDRLLASCHSIVLLQNAVESGTPRNEMISFPIFMLFSSFTASATVAYLSLKGLTPRHAVETAAQIVDDGLRGMHEGEPNWPLMSSWLRHLLVMNRVLNNDAAVNSGSRHNSASHAGGVKDDVSSNADTTGGEAMDYDHHGASGSAPPQGPAPAQRAVSESARGDSEPPVSIPRRPGVTTINGNSGSASNRGTTSPPGGNQYPSYGPSDVKQPSPEAPGNGVPAQHEGSTTSQDMTAPELCNVFERQLLEMDDLAAFMGGGV